MNDVLKELSKRIGYEFKDYDLLKRALTHRSIPGKNNERLEFLGDAVLGCIMATELFKRHPHAREGDLSRMRARLIMGEMLAHLAKDLHLGVHIRLGAGELRSGGQTRISILADALEAVIGAIYLDGGLDACRHCVLQWYGGRFDDLSGLTPEKDSKSKLQEWLQAHKYPLPIYEVKTTGAAHAQTFYVKCCVEGLPYVTEGESNSRRRAEQIAAKKYLNLLDNVSDE